MVQEYDPLWPQVFERLRAPIWSAMSDIACSIEHVGSTSVPGLAAKPVIDMDVVVPEADIEVGIQRLVSLGYEHRGDLGIVGREAFRPPGWLPRHHLYLCESGCSALANHLAVRDYLRIQPSAAEAYGDLKRRLAREFPNDIDGYVEAKTGFLVGILRTVGLPEKTLAEIERVNARPPIRG